MRISMSEKNYLILLEVASILLMISGAIISFSEPYSFLKDIHGAIISLMGAIVYVLTRQESIK